MAATLTRSFSADELAHHDEILFVSFARAVTNV